MRRCELGARASLQRVPDRPHASGVCGPRGQSTREHPAHQTSIRKSSAAGVDASAVAAGVAAGTAAVVPAGDRGCMGNPRAPWASKMKYVPQHQMKMTSSSAQNGKNSWP
mmetsp:Transcript_105353/g.303019  ORF Transcript_105353/g.303019 Transcript_105353/m.303019 type:complete len:110 (+) Transcript_105353:402-731(+)